jgi:hypothetical protein
MKATKSLLVVITLVCLSVTMSLTAAVPGQFSYQGLLKLNNTAYSGTAYFKFALVDPTGTTNFWANDVSPAEPGTSISLPVSAGLFTVNLGDTNVPNMAQLDPSFIFRDLPVFLKIWVSTNNTDFQLLSPIVRLTASPYAFKAGEADSVPNGSITAAKLASNAITGGSQLSLFGSTLRLSDAGGTNSVNLGDLLPAQTNVWKVGGNNVASGDFIGSTNNQALEFRVNNQTALRLEPSANGYPNFISGPTHTVSPGIFASVVIGGGANTMQTIGGTMAGGFANRIESNSLSTVIFGGQNNVIESNNVFSTIIGGYNNRIMAGANYATVIGGGENVAASQSLAAGFLAKATNSGSFVWADGSGTEVTSTANNSVTMRASGGYRLFTGGASSGASLAAGSGSWTSLSDRNAKENFISTDSQQILEKVASLPLSTWNYKAQDKNIRHLGPMAQDFKAAFGLGETDTGISTVDADGVALAAIQGLNTKVESKTQKAEARIQKLETENAELKQRLLDLEQLVRNPSGQK